MDGGCRKDASSVAASYFSREFSFF